MCNPRLAPASLSSRDDSRCAIERTAGTVGTVGIGGAAGFTCDDKGVDTGGFELDQWIGRQDFIHPYVL